MKIGALDFYEKGGLHSIRYRPWMLSSLTELSLPPPTLTILTCSGYGIFFAPSFLCILMIFFRLFVEDQLHSESSVRSMQQLLPLPRPPPSSSTIGISPCHLPPPPSAPLNPLLSARHFHRNLVLSLYSESALTLTAVACDSFLLVSLLDV